jgi:hypothetical protein
MIGSGTPSSQSNAPLPKPMICLLLLPDENAPEKEEFHLRNERWQLKFKPLKVLQTVHF